MQQISQCIQSQNKFKNELCVVVSDSAYSHIECLLETLKNPNQVQISRVRGNRVFYYSEKNENPKKLGRKKRFDKPFKLKDKTTWKEPDETISFDAITKKGKKQLVEIKCWDEIKIG